MIQISTNRLRLSPSPDGRNGGGRAGNINLFHKRNQTRSPLFAVQPPTLMTEIGRILKEEEEEEEEEEKKEPSSPQRN